MHDNTLNPTWEYFFYTAYGATERTLDRLNELGLAGWELVSVIHRNESESDTLIVFIFKRNRGF